MANFFVLKVKKRNFMISSFIKFYKNFTDYFKASSSVSTSFTTSEALLAVVCLYFFVAFFYARNYFI